MPSGIAGTQPDLRGTIALFEPFGLAAFGDATRYFTPVESNSILPPVEGTLLFNRLIVLGVCLLALAVAYLRFSFAEKGISPADVIQHMDPRSGLDRAMAPRRPGHGTQRPPVQTPTG